VYVLVSCKGPGPFLGISFELHVPSTIHAKKCISTAIETYICKNKCRYSSYVFLTGYLDLLFADLSYTPILDGYRNWKCNAF
jgi:hypothetical protein